MGFTGVPQYYGWYLLRVQLANSTRLRSILQDVACSTEKLYSVWILIDLKRRVSKRDLQDKAKWSILNGQGSYSKLSSISTWLLRA